MKRRLSFIFLILSVLLFAGSVYLTADRLNFDALTLTKEDYETLKSSRVPGEEMLLSLSFDDIPLFFNESENEWFFPMTDSILADGPAVDYKTVKKGAKIAFCGEFRPGGNMDIMAYTDKEYREYTLVLTSLPLIRIECDDAFLSIMAFTEDSYPGENIRDAVFPINFTLVDNRPERIMSVISSEGTIHVRGGSTLTFPKKNLRLTLLEKGVGRGEKEFNANLLGLRQDGDWVLYAAYNDQEKVRNVFSSNLWTESCGTDNDFGLKNGMEYRFVELFFNQQYWGLYALGYPIDAKQMKIQPSALGHYDEFLFKQKSFGPNEIGPDGIMLQFEADESDLNNGINLMEVYFDLIKTENQNSLWHNDPKNAVDIWLFFKLCQAYDTVRFTGQTKNVFYMIKMTDEGRKILFTPWDGDNYWGNTWVQEAKNKTVPYGLDADDNSYENTVNPVSFLWKKDPDVKAAVQDRYTELRQGAWSESEINSQIDRLEKEIYDSGAYLRDMERWPDGTYQDPALGLSLFRDYVHRRFLSMDEYIMNL